MKRVAALALAAALAVTPSARAEDTEVAFALPTVSFAFAPIYIADAEQMWAKAGLKVKFSLLIGVNSLNAILSRSVDFSISAAPAVIRAYVRGQKAMMIANTFDGLVTEVVLRKDLADAAGITESSPLEKRAAALKGKKIAVQGLNSIVHGYIRMLARKGGLNSERDFTITPMASEASLAALKSNQIDAIGDVLPWPEIAVHSGTAIMLSSGLRGDFPELLPFNLNGITTQPDHCDRTPKLCQSIVDVYAQGMAFLREHPAEARAILAKRFAGLDPAAFEEAFAIVSKWTARSTRIREDGLRHAQDLMVHAGMIKEDERLASFTELYTNKFAR